MYENLLLKIDLTFDRILHYPINIKCYSTERLFTRLPNYHKQPLFMVDNQ